ncbi:hypothetical protein F4604DRAFT_1697382 [Suillus subluteus]|nr:hypothetical protein F4604DRAFT_1697382 [Suillus subluteus]
MNPGKMKASIVLELQYTGFYLSAIIIEGTFLTLLSFKVEGESHKCRVLIFAVINFMLVPYAFTPR